jgi:hypothetical protein
MGGYTCIRISQIGQRDQSYVLVLPDTHLILRTHIGLDKACTPHYARHSNSSYLVTNLPQNQLHKFRPKSSSYVIGYSSPACVVAHHPNPKTHAH